MRQSQQMTMPSVCSLKRSQYVAIRHKKIKLKSLPSLTRRRWCVSVAVSQTQAKASRARRITVVRVVRLSAGLYPSYHLACNQYVYPQRAARLSGSRRICSESCTDKAAADITGKNKCQCLSSTELKFFTTVQWVQRPFSAQLWYGYIRDESPCGVLWNFLIN